MKQNWKKTYETPDIEVVKMDVVVLQTVSNDSPINGEDPE